MLDWVLSVPARVDIPLKLLDEFLLFPINDTLSVVQNYIIIVDSRNLTFILRARLTMLRNRVLLRVGQLRVWHNETSVSFR